VWVWVWVWACEVARWPFHIHWWPLHCVNAREGTVLLCSGKVVEAVHAMLTACDADAYHHETR
jgi:hypothetical protein